MKAAADKSIYWGVTDSQLWLRIFSKHPSRLRETYQCNKETYKRTTAIIEEEVVSEIHAPMSIYVTGVVRSTLGAPVQTEPQPVTGVESDVMDHNVSQTSPSQNQTKGKSIK